MENKGKDLESKRSNKLEKQHSTLPPKRGQIKAKIFVELAESVSNMTKGLNFLKSEGSHDDHDENSGSGSGS